MTDLNIYRCTPRQVASHVEDCFYAGLVPFVKSSPGVGKSSVIRNVASRNRLKVIDHRISTSQPEDFSGLPRFDPDGLARFSPFADLFPLVNTPIPDGHDGWCLFLDEFNHGVKTVMSASYKLLLDKMVGQALLNPRVAIALAGNLMSDRAMVNQISTALQSRVITIEMMVSHPEWLEDVALAEDYDERIIAFLNFQPDYLMDFKPDHSENTFCAPRTWEFMNRLVRGKPITEDKTSLYAGTITSGVAVEFVQFVQVYADMVDAKDILRDPSGCHIPRDNATKWAIIGHIMTRVTEENFGGFCTYANRFDTTFKILFYRSVMIRQPGLRSHPAFAKAMVELSQFLNS